MLCRVLAVKRFTRPASWTTPLAAPLKDSGEAMWTRAVDTFAAFIPSVNHFSTAASRRLGDAGSRLGTVGQSRDAHFEVLLRRTQLGLLNIPAEYQYGPAQTSRRIISP